MVGKSAKVIGISSTGNDSISAADNIHHSLQMYDAEDKLVGLASQGTDAGGGGTREDLGHGPWRA